MKTNLLFSVLLCVLIGCKKDKPVTVPIENVITSIKDKSFIQPPFDKLIKTFNKYIIDVKAGGEIISKTGIQIKFPINSFVDKEGNVLSGEVTISCREFKDPLDLFLSGIPMTYVTNDNKYVFESGGMFEIYAHQNNKEVFINKNNKPEVFLPTSRDAVGFDFFRLDTVQKQWTTKNELEKKLPVVQEDSDDELSIMDFPKEKMPIKPIIASGTRETFEIEIQTIALFPELKVFENIVFEVDESDTNYNPNDADIDWDRVSIKRSETKAGYVITFKNRQKEVSYRVKPVYEKENFESAIKTYQKEINRIKKEQEIANKKRIKKLREAQSKNFKKNDVNLTVEGRRVFDIDGFGIWNLDKLIKQEGDECFISFTDMNDKPIEINQYTIVYKELNAVFKCNTSKKCKILRRDNIMIWTVIDQQFAYVKFDWSEKNINKINLTLKLSILDKKVTSEKDIRKALGLE